MILVWVIAILVLITGAIVAWRWRSRLHPPNSTNSPHQPGVEIGEELPTPAAPGANFGPQAFLTADPNQPAEVVLVADEEFLVESVSYYTGSGKFVAREALNLQGKSVAHAIEDQYLRAVLRVESNPWDGSAGIQLRFRTVLSDLKKADIVLVAAIVPEIRLGPGGRMREFHRLIDPRNAPSRSELVN